MNNQASVIDGMLGAEEHILWRGNPLFIGYVLALGPGFFVGIVWGIIDVSSMAAVFGRAERGELPLIFFISFFMLHMIPFWLAIGAPIYRALNWKYVDYVVTDKRIYIQSGLVGRDVKSVEFTDVTRLSVNVGLVGRQFDCGTIPLSSRHKSNGNTVSDTAFIAVENPYEVYKLIKDLALDVKSDIYYPNAMRPENNPGYNTELDKDRYPRFPNDKS